MNRRSLFILTVRAKSEDLPVAGHNRTKSGPYCTRFENFYTACGAGIVEVKRSLKWDSILPLYAKTDRLIDRLLHLSRSNFVKAMRRATQMRFHPHPMSKAMQTSMIFISPRHTPSAPVQAEIQNRPQVSSFW